MKRRLLSIITALALCLGLLPTGALAADGDVSYRYYDASGTTWQTGTKGTGEYTEITTSNKSTSWSNSWYVINSTVSYSSRITVTGDVHLILADGCTLTANDGITVNEGNSLTIYGQSGNTGTLTATGYSGGAGIGGDNNANGGTITIHGGIISANGYNDNYAYASAGIGGGYRGNSGTITINGGNVTATGGSYSAGIGGGSGRSGNNITINGGTIIATGGEDAAGIGGGRNYGSGGNGGTITITGGNVTATSPDDGAGIGGGYDSTSGTIIITGGNVTATGGSGGAGIGGGGSGAVDRITIHGGNVTATGGSSSSSTGAGIGGGYGESGGTIEISGGTVTATGGSGNYTGAGIGGGGSSNGGGSGGTITINGGTVEAASGSGDYTGAGIGGGGGSGNSGGNITITGGNVTATGSNGSYRPGAGIGGGGYGSGGIITISGGYVTATGGTPTPNTSYSNGAGIGGGSNSSTDNGTFSTGTGGNAEIVASSIGDTSGKTNGSWSGIIFDGNEGGVYGTQSLNTDLTIESGKPLTICENATLVIPENVTLVISENATLTNNGTLTSTGNTYVDGKLNGTSTVTGNVYSRLSLTNCTASSGTTTYLNNTYAKVGAMVKLNTTFEPSNQFVSWSGTAGTGSDSEYKIDSMPAETVTVTATINNALTIDTQPQNANIAYGGTTTLSVGVTQHSDIQSYPLSYQWNQDGTPIYGANSNSYTTPTNLSAGSHIYTCKITCEVNNNKQYNVTSHEATVTVTQATITVTPNSEQTKVYNTADPTLTYTYSGQVNSETPAFSGSLSRADGADTGAYAITIGTLTLADSSTFKASNYTLALSANTVNFTITQANPTITIAENQKPEYDGTAVTAGTSGADVNYSYNGDGTVTVKWYADNNGSKGNEISSAPISAGTYWIGVSAAESTNYQAATEATQKFEIAPKPVTVTIDSKSSAYGEDIVPLTATDNGIVSGDTNVYTLSTDATKTSPVGSYTITGSDTSDNYDVTFVNGTYTISNAANSWTTAPADTSWTYGDTNPTLPSAAAKFGTVTVEYRPATSTNDADYTVTVPTNAGSYTVRFTVAGTDNYAGLSTEKELTITPKTIGITWSNTNLTYNGQAQKPSATATGLESGDNCTITVGGAKTDAGSGYTATAESVSNDNYQLPTDKTKEFTIKPKEVTVAAGDYKVSKTYDSTTSAGTSSGTLQVTGILSTDSGVTVDATPVAYTSADVGQSTMDVGIGLSGTGCANYKIKDDATTIAVPCEITAKALTLTGATAGIRDYAEGNTSVTINDVTFGDVVAGETLTLGTDYTATGTIADANAGTGKNVNVTVTLTNSNYSLANNTTTTTVDINKITWTKTTTSSSAMYGNTGTVDLSNFLAPGGSFGTVTKNDTNSVLYDDPSMDGNSLKFTFKDTAENVDKSATITVPVTNATNYNDYEITVTVNVTAKNTPVVTAPTAKTDLTYSGTAQTLINAGSTTGGTLWYKVDNGTYSADLPKATNAGTYTVYYKVVGNLSYAHVAENSINVTIGQREVTVSGITAENKTYDGNTSATLNYGTAQLNGKVGSDELTVTATGAFADANVGTNKTVNITGLTLGGSSKDNYKLASTGQQSTATASITQKPVTATVTVTDKTYDGSTNATVSAVVTTGLISNDTVTITGLTGTFADANVGTSKSVTVNATGASITGSGSGNYDVTIPGTATGNITPKTIGITWSNTNLTYNGQAQTPTATATGLVGNDTCNITVTGQQTNAGSGYTATAKSVSNSNYQLPTSNLTQGFSIDPKPVTARIIVTSKTYDGTTDAEVSAKVTDVDGLVTGDTITITGLTGTFDNPNAGPGKTVTVNDENKSITGDGNYTVTIPGTATGTIQKASQVAPAAPTENADATTSVKIELNPIASTGYGAVEYCVSTTNSALTGTNPWQTATAFTGLTKNTQ